MIISQKEKDRILKLHDNRRISEGHPINEIICGGMCIAGVVVTVADIIYSVWSGVSNGWGTKNTNESLEGALDENTWGKIEQAFKEISEKVEQLPNEAEIESRSIEDAFDIISYNESHKYANELHQAFNDPSWFSNTDEEKILTILDSLPTYLDLARIADTFGVKDGYTFKEYLKDELGVAEWESSVVSVMAGKPIAIFNDKQYFTIEDLIEGMQSKVKSDANVDEEKYEEVLKQKEENSDLTLQGLRRLDSTPEITQDDPEELQETKFFKKIYL